MIGFEVRFKDKVIYASTGGEGILPVIVSYCNNSVYLSITSYSSSTHSIWHSGKINNVDEVKVKVVEVEQNSELIETYSDDSDIGLIEDYYALKREIEILKREIEEENYFCSKPIDVYPASKISVEEKKKILQNKLQHLLILESQLKEKGLI